MSCNLPNLLVIQKENLSQEFYLQSLMQEAYRVQLLNDSELEDIQAQSIMLLSDIIKKYTKGESSSVPATIAQSISKSIFYTVGIYLKTFTNIENSVDALLRTPLIELYESGKKVINKEVRICRLLYTAVERNMLSIENYTYKETIKNGISSFFNAYNVDYSAHDTLTSIDYQLSTSTFQYVGVEFMKVYLQNLLRENQFCKYFSPDKIHLILRGYNEDYNELLINIFEKVLINAIGCILCNKNVYELTLNHEDREYIRSNIVNCTREELNYIFSKALKILIKTLNIDDLTLEKYALEAIPRISISVEKAIETNTLENIFLSSKKEEFEPKMYFEDGENMKGNELREFIDELKTCRFISDKIAMVKNDITSIGDLITILESGCFLKEEYKMFFDSLGEIELSLLFNELPSHMDDRELHFSEEQRDWHNALEDYFKSLPASRIKEIKINYH